MTTTAISKRYPVFIDFFQAQVTQAQKVIEEHRAGEPCYNAVREALIKVNLPWDFKITMSRMNVYVRASIGANDRAAEVEPLLNAIHDNLVRVGLRSPDHEMPELTGSTYSHSLDWLIYGRRAKGSTIGYIFLTLEIPIDTGCLDWAVVSSSVTTTETRHKTVKRSQPRRPQLVKADDVEAIPF